MNCRRGPTGRHCTNRLRSCQMFRHILLLIATFKYDETNLPHIFTYSTFDSTPSDTSSQTFTPFTVASCFIIDCQQQPMLHVIHSLLQLADMNPLLITAALFQDRWVSPFMDYTTAQLSPVSSMPQTTRNKTEKNFIRPNQVHPCGSWTK